MPNNKSVSFSTISKRVYNVTIGDNPSVTLGGPPLALTWCFTQHDAISINDYENQRPQRRTGLALKLTATQRHERLVYGFGISPYMIQRQLQQSIPKTPQRMLRKKNKSSKKNNNKHTTSTKRGIQNPTPKRKGPPAAA